MSLQAGYNGKLYRNSATYNSPTWVEIKNVADLALNIEDTMHEVTTRSLNGIKGYFPTLREYGVEFKMNYDKSDSSGFTPIRTAFLARTSIEYAIADGPIATPGTLYLRGKLFSSGFPAPQNLGETMAVDIKLVVDGSETTNPPAWVTVS